MGRHLLGPYPSVELSGNGDTEIKRIQVLGVSLVPE